MKLLFWGYAFAAWSVVCLSLDRKDEAQFFCLTAFIFLVGYEVIQAIKQEVDR